MSYERLTSSDAAILYVDHQTGLANRVQTLSPPEYINNVRALVTIAEIVALSAQRAGYEVYAVMDASGTWSKLVEEAAPARMVQAGIIPMTWVGVGGELLSDWRSATGQAHGSSWPITCRSRETTSWGFSPREPRDRRTRSGAIDDEANLWRAAPKVPRPRPRRIVRRTMRHRQGPIVRLMNPRDIGELVKPFVFLDYFEFPNAVKSGLPVRPHSGIAAHTTLLQGSVDYADSTGKAGTPNPRSIEWMQAGGGVWHGDGPSFGESLRGFQLWIALPPSLELASAFSDYVDDDSIPRDGGTRLLLGTYRGMESTIQYREPVTYLSVRLRDGERWTYQRFRATRSRGSLLRRAVCSSTGIR